MRRFVVFALATVVATGATLVVGMATASAHICPIAARVPVGRPGTIAVGVTVEGATVSDVQIGIPSGLRLERVDAKAGWVVTRSGATVRYRGGPIPPYSCEYFSLAVTAPARGSFGISVVQRDAAGTVVADSTPDPNSAASRVLDQFVYAGIEPPSPPSTTTGLSGTSIAGIALLALGAVMFVVLRIRAWRLDRYEQLDDPNDTAAVPGGAVNESDREAELTARLAEFKKRTPGPRRSL